MFGIRAPTVVIFVSIGTPPNTTGINQDSRASIYAKGSIYKHSRGQQASNNKIKLKLSNTALRLEMKRILF